MYKYMSEHFAISETRYIIIPYNMYRHGIDPIVYILF